MNLEAGEIRIGASDMTLQNIFILVLIKQFHEKYPGIKVVVTNAPTPETISNLEEGKLILRDHHPFFGEAGLPYEGGQEIEDIFVAGRKYFQLII